MQYRNPEGYFSTSHLPWCFQSRILPRFFLKSRVPSFKYGKFRILKTYWGHCIRHYEAWNSFKSSKLYEALLKIAINLRSHDHFKVIYLKNFWKQVAIKWRGYWSKFSLYKCCSSSTALFFTWKISAPSYQENSSHVTYNHCPVKYLITIIYN